jgi:hypothetical protein
MGRRAPPLSHYNQSCCATLTHERGDSRWQSLGARAVRAWERLAVELGAREELGGRRSASELGQFGVLMEKLLEPCLPTLSPNRTSSPIWGWGGEVAGTMSPNTLHNPPPPPFRDGVLGPAGLNLPYLILLASPTPFC